MDSRKLICAGIVTYNPDLQRLQENIDAIKRNGISHIIIVDNGSKNYAQIYNRFHSPEILFVSNSENMGIAYALNQIFDAAVSYYNSDWVLTLDQDSIIGRGMIDAYLPYLNEIFLASLTPLICEQAIGVVEKHDDIETEEIYGCITSGNLVKVSAWKEIGGFDCRLFIDMVDYDFCFRLKEYGHRILRVNKALLVQEMGRKTKAHFFGKTIFVNNYSAFRNYYFSRNWHYLMRSYSYAPKIYRKTEVFRRFVKTVLYETNKREKTWQLLRGAWDSHYIKRAEFIPWCVVRDKGDKQAI